MLSYKQLWLMLNSSIASMKDSLTPANPEKHGDSWNLAGHAPGASAAKQKFEKYELHALPSFAVLLSWLRLMPLPSANSKVCLSR
jgi:hypothetical protein